MKRKILFSILFVLAFLLGSPILITEPVLSSETPISIHEEELQRLSEGYKLHVTRDAIANMTDQDKEYSPDHVMVILKNIDTKNVSSIASSLNSSIPQDQLENSNNILGGRYVRMDVPEGMTVETFLVQLNQREDVLIAEPAYKRTLFYDPGDPGFDSPGIDGKWQWHLQDRGTDYSIEMPKAWDSMNLLVGDYGGSSDVTIGILDTGLAYENRTVSLTPDSYEDGWDFDPDPELPNNIYVNLDEDGANATDGIDNPLGSGNGLIDDWHGVNFMDYYWYRFCTTLDEQDPLHCTTYTEANPEEGHPNDDYGHGNFVANIIAGKTGNGAGGAGIAFGTTILPIKIFNFNGGMWSSSVIDGLQYAIEAEVDIVNMSFGGYIPNVIEEAKVNEAVAAGILPVVASGNEWSSTPQYPAAYQNAMAIGASQKDGTRVGYSSYGNWLDMVAPIGALGTGFYQNNYSCYFQGDEADPIGCTQNYQPVTNAFTNFTFSSSEGTSFAAPQVAAVAGLVKTVDPDAGPFHLRYILRESALDVESSGFDSQTGYGVLNANNAVLGKRPGGTTGVLNRSEDWYYNVSGWNVNSTRFVASGDFDGDLNEDLCALYYYGGTTVKALPFLSDGSSEFSLDQWFAHYGWYVNRTEFMVSGDFNGDNRDDIAFMHRTSSSPYGIQIIVLVSTGTSFQKQVWYTHAGWYPTDSHFMNAGDFDGDGNDDIVVMHNKTVGLPYGINMIVLKSTGSSFQKQVWYTHHGWYPADSHHMVTGDFSGDGKDDIAIMHNKTVGLPYGINMIVLKSTGSSFQKQVWYSHSGWYPTETEFMVASDVDNDSDDDISVMHLMNHDSDRMYLYRLSSNGTSLQKSTWYSTESGTWDTTQSKFMNGLDVDGDGSSEIGVIDDLGSNTMVSWVFTD